MSKSLGNFTTARDLLDQGVAGEAIRYTLLSAHYRQPLDWSMQGLESSKKSLDKFYKILDDLKNVADIDAAIPDEMMDALCDELNTPKAYAVLNALAKTAAETRMPEDKAAFKNAANILGFLKADPAVWKADGPVPIEGMLAMEVNPREGRMTSPSAEILEKANLLLMERQEAKRNKDYARADEIRAELTALRFSIQDNPDGTTSLFVL